MKSFISIWILVILISACKSLRFQMVKEVDRALPLQEFVLDPTCHLYKRSICKDMRNFPIDCQGDSIKPVETQYIIISDSNKQVLIINNQPSRKQKFFSGKEIFQKNIVTDTTLIDVFYFKQFRFGTLEPGLIWRQMKFETIEKHSTTYLWNFENNKDVIEIKSIATVVPDGQDLRHTDTGLFLIPRYRKNKAFKFAFDLPKDKESLNTSEIPICRIFVHKKSEKNYVTYFEFDKPVFKDFKAIKFTKKRMYAFSSMNNDQ